MTVKFSENSILCGRGPSEYIKIIKLYLYRYFQIRQRTPSNFILMILYVIPYVWANEDLFCTTKRQTKTTRRTRRKFLTNLMGQLSNRRLVSTVLETKNEKCPLTDSPQAYVCIYPQSVRVKFVL